jgi:hypothetical protein
MILLEGQKAEGTRLLPRRTVPMGAMTEREVRALRIESVLDLSAAVKKGGC